MDNDSAHRILWLVLAPTAVAVLTWIVLFLAGDWTEASLTVAALLPLAGLVPAPAYRWLSRDPMPMWPFALLAVATGVFTVATLDLAASVAAEPDGAQIPVLTVGIGFFLPVIAAACGIGSITAAARRPGPWA